MAKGRPPEQNVDIGARRATAQGVVYPTEKEAAIYAKKHGGRVVQVKDGWLAKVKSRRKSN